jgi:hypothetical protein
VNYDNVRAGAVEIKEFFTSVPKGQGKQTILSTTSDKTTIKILIFWHELQVSSLTFGVNPEFTMVPVSSSTSGVSASKCAYWDDISTQLCGLC